MLTIKSQRYLLGDNRTIARLNYRRLLNRFGMHYSMSRKGNGYDNAPIESFWGTLKNKWVYHRRYETRAAAKSEIPEYNVIFYNRQKRHFKLGNLDTGNVCITVPATGGRFMGTAFTIDELAH